MTVSFSIKTSASRREIPSCRARNLLSRSDGLLASCGVFIAVTAFLEDYSVVCGVGVSARAVSSNSKPEPDVLLLAVAGVGICAGGVEEAESGGAAAKRGVVWFVAGCFVLLPPCAGVAVCGAIGAVVRCDIGVDCTVYDGDVDVVVGADVGCCGGMEDICA